MIALLLNVCSQLVAHAYHYSFVHPEELNPPRVIVQGHEKLAKPCCRARLHLVAQFIVNISAQWTGGSHKVQQSRQQGRSPANLEALYYSWSPLSERCYVVLNNVPWLAFTKYLNDNI